MKNILMAILLLISITAWADDIQQDQGQQMEEQENNEFWSQFTCNKNQILTVLPENIIETANNNVILKDKITVLNAHKYKFWIMHFYSKDESSNDFKVYGNRYESEGYQFTFYEMDIKNDTIKTLTSILYDCAGNSIESTYEESTTRRIIPNSSAEIWGQDIKKYVDSQKKANGKKGHK